MSSANELHLERMLFWIDRKICQVNFPEYIRQFQNQWLIEKKMVLFSVAFTNYSKFNSPLALFPSIFTSQLKEIVTWHSQLHYFTSRLLINSFKIQTKYNAFKQLCECGWEIVLKIEWWCSIFPNWMHFQPAAFENKSQLNWFCEE